jgi:serine/threonine-protein kinase mTOR
VLVELLRYDPLAVQQAGAAGYGAGSGAPDVMFGFLKHLWHTGEQQQALFRCAGVADGS